MPVCVPDMIFYNVGDGDGVGDVPDVERPPSVPDVGRLQRFGTTIVWRSAGQPLAAPSYDTSYYAAYEARNVFLRRISAEVLLRNLNVCTAATVYKEWLECEVIIGKRATPGDSGDQGRHLTSRWRSCNMPF